MNIKAELQQIQTLLFEQISSAASSRNVAKVAELSGLAKECKALEAELMSLNRRVEAVKHSLNGSRSISIISAKPTYSADAVLLSRREVGRQVRSEWMAALLTLGISLDAYGKRYQTTRGQSVGVAFANECPKYNWPWFLGLPDEPTDIVVLLCKSLKGNLHDIVLPVSLLPGGWEVLSKSKSGVKFNVKKDTGAGRFLLQIPKHSPLDVSMYIGDYAPLR